MSQIAQTQTPIALKDRHVSATISRESHNALRDAVRRLGEAGAEDATINGLLNELVARHLPALVRARVELRVASVAAEAQQRIAAMRAAAGIRLPCHHTNAWECKDVKCTKHRPMIKKDVVDDF